MPSNWVARPYPMMPVSRSNLHKGQLHEGPLIFNKAVYMNCFDVFIIVLITVILVVYHHDHLVTTFELSHILTNTLNNVFLLHT